MLSAQKYGENLHVNYSPFGAILYGRNWSSEKYRYGFNGMEKDDELKGNGNSYDFGARMYDSRLGRWLSLDELVKETPSLSAYSFAGNSPIAFIDINGYFKFEVSKSAKETMTKQEMVNFEKILKNIEAYLSSENGKHVLNELAKQTGLEPERILKDFKYGDGPVIMISKWGDDYREEAGATCEKCFKDKGGYIIMNVGIIQQLEKSTENNDEFGKSVLAVAGTIIHEYAHYGDIEKNGRITGAVGGDFGKQNMPSYFRHRGSDVENAFYSKYKISTGSGIKLWGGLAAKDMGNGLYTINTNDKDFNNYLNKKFDTDLFKWTTNKAIEIFINQPEESTPSDNNSNDGK